MGHVTFIRPDDGGGKQKIKVARGSRKKRKQTTLGKKGRKEKSCGKHILERIGGKTKGIAVKQSHLCS